MDSFLGIDTSNYTTSCAVYTADGSLSQRKKLLPVKHGELGLRQSDAVFHHTVQLPELMTDLFDANKYELKAVGVSDAPRRAEGSYMPCFLAGVNAASAVSCAAGIPLYRFSHQQGHIAAAVFSAGRHDLFEREFLAFHVSGGTTDALLVTPDEDEIIKVTALASSLDLKAGQAVDRVGVMLGFPFPAGRYVDALAQKSGKKYSVNIKLKDGNCCLSGIENKCAQMLACGESKEDICRYCLDSIISAVEKMTGYQLEKLGDVPVLYAGGVMSSEVIRAHFADRGVIFAQPEFSSDNAAGTALLASMKYNRRG